MRLWRWALGARRAQSTAPGGEWFVWLIMAAMWWVKPSVQFVVTESREVGVSPPCNAWWRAGNEKAYEATRRA